MLFTRKPGYKEPSKMKPLFPEYVRNALKSGKTISADIGGEPFELRVDKTHGECVCKVVDDEETPLFSVRYLDSTYRVSRWHP